MRYCAKTFLGDLSIVVDSNQAGGDRLSVVVLVALVQTRIPVLEAHLEPTAADPVVDSMDLPVQNFGVAFLIAHHAIHLCCSVDGRLYWYSIEVREGRI
jgi:hypothetical protein